ncbi:MAG: glycogen/starch synthase [Planctomycetota bacterium]
MKIAFATPELNSLVRRTQLAEIAELLPRTLQALGADVRVFLPYSVDIDPDVLGPLEESALLRIRDGSTRTPITIRTGYVEGLTVHLIDHADLFRSRHPYGDENGPYADNWRRYAIFARAVLEGLGPLAFTPDVIHCFDWTAGLIPLVQKLEYEERDQHPAAHPGTFFAIQNLAMQGSFEREILPKIGIPHPYFRAVDGVELGGRVNYLKAGAEFATIVGTTSPSKALQLVSTDRGDGLEETFRRREKELVGVQSGIDYRTWDPATDPLLAQNYSAEQKDFPGKRKCKATLQEGLKLDVGPRTPMLAVIGRFDADSGFDILAEALTPILERNVELVLMGPGPPEIIERLHTIEQTFAGRCRVIEGYDVSTAHTLLAGADMLMLPGHYHATNALAAIAMRYGVVPIAYAHSGLEDTLIDLVGSPKKGTGLLFERYEPDAVVEAVDHGRTLYKKAADWKLIIARCMEQDFSWAESGREYLKAYRRVTRRSKTRKS